LIAIRDRRLTVNWIEGPPFLHPKTVWEAAVVDGTRSSTRKPVATQAITAPVGASAGVNIRACPTVSETVGRTFKGTYGIPASAAAGSKALPITTATSK